MTTNWLYDRKITDAEARKVFRAPEDPRFEALAALLLARTNDAQHVFKTYISPIVFCRTWPNVKRVMRKNSWSDPRIVFWQAIYEKLARRYRVNGVAFRNKKSYSGDPLFSEVGRAIALVRRAQGLSQSGLAAKMKVSQQLVSRVEKGGENVSLTTLAIFARALGRKVRIDFIE